MSYEQSNFKFLICNKIIFSLILWCKIKFREANKRNQSRTSNSEKF